MSDLLGVRHVQTTASGTCALLIALQALKQLKPERKTVIVSAYTCPKIAIAVKAAGLRLGICDTAANSVDFDYYRLEQICGADTLSIVSTHIAGLFCDVSRTLDVARSVGAFLIEDAAQAFGACLHDKPAGTTGDIGVFSLGFGKGPELGSGGFLTTDDTELYHLASSIAKSTAKPWSLKTEIKAFAHLLQRQPFEKFSVAERSNFAASIDAREVSPYRRSVVSAQLRRLGEVVARNNVRARERVAMLQQVPALQVLVEQPGERGSWPYIFVTFPKEQDCVQLLEEHHNWGVSQLYVFALPDYRFLNFPVPAVHTPNAQSMASRSLTVTNSQLLQNEQFEQIVHCMQRTLKY